MEAEAGGRVEEAAAGRSGPHGGRGGASDSTPCRLTPGTPGRAVLFRGPAAPHVATVVTGQPPPPSPSVERAVRPHREGPQRSENRLRPVLVYPGAGRSRTWCGGTRPSREPAHGSRKARRGPHAPSRIPGRAAAHAYLPIVEAPSRCDGLPWAWGTDPPPATARLHSRARGWQSAFRRLPDLTRLVASGLPG